jgi:hypothetical protein
MLFTSVAKKFSFESGSSPGPDDTNTRKSSAEIYERGIALNRNTAATSGWGDF